MDLYGVIVDTDGNPVSGAVVSDGFSCVLTDGRGVYQMKKSADAAFVFYSTPSGYAIRTAGSMVNAATFWADIHASSQRYDFTLERLPAPETDFTLICIGDPQVASAAEISRFKTETVSDLKTFLAARPGPCYALVLGDVVNDHLELLSSMRTVMGALPVPYFTTIGNHDHDRAVTGNDAAAGRPFEAVFGPLNYSFNRGDVHFVCLDNVIHRGPNDYTAGFTDARIEWLRQDLSHVPKSRMLIVYYHIPLRNTSSYANRAAMLNLLKGFAGVHLMAGHTHYSENFPVTDTLSTYEHIHGAACGAWWKSTVNVDGAPNGYAVYDVKGARLSNWLYKSTGYPADFQIRLHRGDTSFGGSNGYFGYGKGANDIIANIWNADSGWTVEVYEDGRYAGVMTRLPTVVDAFAAGYHVGVLGRVAANYGATGSGANKHAYCHTLRDPAAAVIEVRATDCFGTEYRQSEIISDLRTAAGY
jgi:hypothetical protein